MRFQTLPANATPTTSENIWEHLKTPVEHMRENIWHHPENNWELITVSLVQFEEDFNTHTGKDRIRWWSQNRRIPRSPDVLVVFWLNFLAVSNCPTIVYSLSGSVNGFWYLVSLYLLKILIKDFIKLMWKVSAGEYFQSVFKSANLNLSAPIFKTLFMRHSQRAQCLPS